MKNIFLLPTEKESNLAIIDNKLFQYDTHVRFLSGRGVDGIYTQNQFIYITNDEKFKKDEWITDGIEVMKAYSKVVEAQGLVNRRDWKKVVLTNDTTLIADGVQQVNSSFLSFYAENTPDYVEVRRVRKEYVDDQDAYGYDVDYYSLIFSVEDLKTEKWVKHCSDKYEKWAGRNSVDYSKMLSEFETLEGITSNMFDGKDWARFDRFVENREKEKPEQDIIMELQKDPLLKEFDNKVNENLSTLKNKIETEEYSEIQKKSLEDNKQFVERTDKNKLDKLMSEFDEENIIDQWLEKNGNPEITKQVEREAEELELEIEAQKLYPIKDINWTLKPQKDAFIKGAKWQKSRMYTEEEVIALIHRFNYDLVNSNIETFKEWFDEHKK